MLTRMTDPGQPTLTQAAAAGPAQTATLVPPQLPGYALERHIGRGGMGDVWLARHQTLDRQVALKVVRGEYASDPAYVDRFLREARAAAKVNHPRVVTVHDAGQVEGVLYLAMEYVSGGDLHDRLNGTAMPEAEALRLLRGIADGLQAIHDVGLVHRDLKPENIFLDAEGLPKIGDLGLARSRAGDDRMTVTGQAVGTPAYMSPEQANGAADIDARSDIYSLAATGFALLTGRPPFVGATPWATVAQVINDPAPDPRQCNATISHGVAQALRAALAKDPARRPATAQAFVAMLTAPPGTVVLPAPATAGRSWWRWRPVQVAAGMVMGVALAGILVAAATSDDGPVAVPATAPVPTRGTSPKSAAPIASASTGGNGSKPAPALHSVFSDIKTGIRGTTREATAGTVVQQHPRARRAMERNGASITKDVVDEGRGVLEGTFAAGGEWRIITTRLNADSVEFAIQVGAFGDQARQQTILEWLHAQR